MTDITNGNVRRIVLLSAAILLATTLAGCTPAANGLFNEKPAAVAKTAMPTPTVAAPKPGDTLTEAQAVALRKSLPKNGDWVYKTAAGVNVFINSHAPLPDVVKTDMSAQMVASARAAQAAGDPMGGDITKTRKMLQTMAGKPIILISQIYTFLWPSFETKGWTWSAPAAIRPDDSKHGQITSKAEAIQIAHTFINAQADPSAWEIVIAE